MSPAPQSLRLCLLFVLLFLRIQNGKALLSFHGLQHQSLTANSSQKTNWQTQETKKSVGLKQSLSRGHRSSGHYHVTIAEDPSVPTGSVATKKKKFPGTTTTPRASLLGAGRVGTLAVLLAMSHPQLASAAGATDVSRGAKAIQIFQSCGTFVRDVVLQLSSSSLAPVAILSFVVNKSISDAGDKTDLKIEGVKTELKADIDKVKTELKTDIDKVNGKIDKVKTELKTDIDKVGMEIRLLNEKIDGKLDNQDKAIANIQDEKSATINRK